MPIRPGRVNRVASGQSTRARSAHSAPNPTSIASASHGNGGNASWEVSDADGFCPARQIKQQSELDVPIRPGRVNRVTSGESTSARSAHAAPSPTSGTVKPLATAPNNESPFALSRDRSVITGQFSKLSPTTAMMPRNVTMQRIKENDVFAKCTSGKNSSWEVSQTKQQSDLTNIMSKMVTSTGLGCGNMRVASVHDFREAITAPNPATEFISKSATQTPGSQSGHRSVSSGQFYNRGEATGIMPRNVTLQRIKEEANVASGAGAAGATREDAAPAPSDFAAARIAWATKLEKQKMKVVSVRKAISTTANGADDHATAGKREGNNVLPSSGVRAADANADDDRTARKKEGDFVFPPSKYSDSAND